MEQQNQINQNSKAKLFFQILKFTLFSISAAVVEFGVFTLLSEVFKWSYWPSYLPALICSVIWNFTFNRKFTFKSANNVPIAMLKVFLFYLVFTPLSTLWGDALENAGWNEYLILVPTMLINFVTEFLYCKFFVFKEKTK